MPNWSPQPAPGTRPPWIPIASGTAFLALAITVALHVDVPHRLDTAVSLAAYRFAGAHPAWLTTMAVATRAGEAAIVIPVAALAVALLARRRHWHSVIVISASLITIPAVRFGISVAFHRARPQDLLSTAHGWAFPSGHTTTAAVAALVTAYVAWPYACRAWHRGAIAAAAAAWAITVAVSRVALVVRWPSDVVGGLLLATALVSLIVWLTTAFGPPRDRPVRRIDPTPQHQPSDPAPPSPRRSSTPETT
ncbi:undecaprenyl-diphosphatase [Allocatelliglobosispora scoriae]|uniref:Undecaprenyl-diphosphatase n=1 Tax=Allocatelliglobosispora scoriae TaxID=643052 RepID=A0A841BJK7_9ACTN|nr:phosphatase PAP2 family protein [Allocatelliglobosispora scoriae]MBB5867518.1 undecaprenyl-diphosphatase [Allocatelliglobosispora scoriae]